ncbi:MAG: hypothetical protein E2590_12745 [Chryseobacterium sp.]|nr:hypothetical protein [Chryseobacterium sp.]
MKKLLLFLLISGFVFGQNFDRFKTLDSTQMLKVTEEIVLATGKNFVYVGDDNSHGRLTKIYKEVNESPNEEIRLNVSFSTFYDGENKALEVKGVKRWSLRAVSGKFLAIAPIWKNYFDPNADIIKMSKDTWIRLPYPKTSLFQKNPDYDNFWTIYFRD